MNFGGNRSGKEISYPSFPLCKTLQPIGQPPQAIWTASILPIAPPSPRDITFYQRNRGGRACLNLPAVCYSGRLTQAPLTLQQPVQPQQQQPPPERWPPQHSKQEVIFFILCFFGPNCITHGHFRRLDNIWSHFTSQIVHFTFLSIWLVKWTSFYQSDRPTCKMKSLIYPFSARECGDL
jgi:hypothetical protein